MRKSIWQRVKPWCVPLVLTLLIYIMLRSVFLIGYVPSASMEPTLHEGSFILVYDFRLCHIFSNFPYILV